MVYMFLKNRKKEADVKQYSVNSKDGIIKIEFIDHEKAVAFYHEANFSDKILVRPFNIYFNLTLNDTEMKKFYLEGITEDNQKRLFEIAVKLGVCKLYTSYGAGTRGKLKSTGLLSFIRKDSIPEDSFKKLVEEFGTIGIKISNYVHEKGMKVSLNLLNYVSDSHYDTDEVVLQELAEKEAKAIIERYTENVNINHLSVILKKKEVLDKETKIQKLQTSALFEFEATETTYQVYEKVRKGLKDEALGKVRLFFHSEENNSFLSLITQGLSKPEGCTDKQFEEDLIEHFRTINANVVQVNIYPVVYNKTYIGRVYLKSEEEGKNFLVEYANYRSKLYKFYKERSNPIIFNITVDTKTLRKIKFAEKKAKETEEKIKKQTEANRRDTRRNPNNQLPLQNSFNPMGMLPMAMPPGMNVPGLPPRMEGGMMGMAPFPNKGMPGPSPMGPPQPQGHQAANIRVKISNLVKDKQRFLDMDENAAKRVLAEHLKGLADEQGTASGADAIRHISKDVVI